MGIQKRIQYHPGLVAFFLTLALTLLVMSRLLPDFTHRTIPTITRENFACFWNLWWVHHALAESQSIYFTDLLYFPYGTTLSYTEFTPLYGILSLPLSLFGESPYRWVFAFNAIVLLSFPLTAYTTFLWVRRESGQRGGAILVAALVAFAAYRVHHLEHLNLLSTYWLPLGAWLVSRWCLYPFTGNQSVSASRWNLAGLSGVGLGLAGTSYLYLSYLGLFLTVWAVGLLLTARSRWRPRFFARLGTAAAALVVGAIPLSLAWIQGLSRGDMPAAPASEAVRWSPDLAAYFLPVGPAWGKPWVGKLTADLHQEGLGEVYLGLGLLVLGGVGLILGKRRFLPLGLAALVGGLLSLGPGIWFLGSHHDILMPYDAISGLPFFQAGRVTGRLVLLVMLALGPVAAWAWSRLPLGKGAALGVAALFVLDVFPGVLTPESVRLDPVYQRLADQPQSGAVLELSLDPWRKYDSMFTQIVHQRPLFGGALYRPSPGVQDKLREINIAQRFQSPQTMPGALQDLAKLGYGFLVWRNDRMTPDQWKSTINFYSRYLKVIDRGVGVVVFELSPPRAANPFR